MSGDLESRCSPAMFLVAASTMVGMLIACGTSKSTHDAGGDDWPWADAGPDVADVQVQRVSLRFVAKINGAPFACGQSYANVGNPPKSYKATDFRFYVHDVALLTADGTEASVAFDADGVFQQDKVALLDFEDGGAGCAMGTAALHTELSGSVAPGDYTKVRFKLGVPADLNHLDAATAPPPLSDTTMWWVWRSGYKFLKADGVGGDSPGQAFNLHVGSTGCPGDVTTAPPTGSCANPNVAEVHLDGFRPATSVIVADVGRVLAGVDIAANATGTAPGCMSAPNDPDCTTIFPKLGLPIGSTGAGNQVFFTVE